MALRKEKHPQTSTPPAARPPEISPDLDRFYAVVLLWTDAAFHAEHADSLLPIPALTFGVVWEETDDYIKIASEIFADGEARSFCVVPKGAMSPVVIPLKHLKIPKEFIQYQLRLLPYLS